jgi:CDGSH-type Zn-finger protein
VSPMPNGPLLMRGPIRVVRADGSSEELPRAAFCRCGQSNNKPFCDGTHREVGFKE